MPAGAACAQKILAVNGTMVPIFFKFGANWRKCFYNFGDA